MKRDFWLPVIWEVWDEVPIKASTLEEAVTYFKENIDSIPLGREPKYIDDSFKLDDGQNGEASIEEAVKFLKDNDLSGQFNLICPVERLVVK